MYVCMNVLPLHLTETFVTFVTSWMLTGSNFKTASAVSGLFSRFLTPKVRQGKVRQYMSHHTQMYNLLYNYYVH